MTEGPVQCAFCNQTSREAWPMVAGHGAYICADCVRTAQQIVTSWEDQGAGLPDVEASPAPADLHGLMDEQVVGQQQAKEILAIAVHNHYKRLRSETESVRDSQRAALGKSNILLLGPSGSGKTLLLQTLARAVDVPFVVADATTLTQTGYVGEDVESLLARLVEAADGHVGRAEWGIVYVDEVDKLAGSAENATGTRDVAGEGVQQALLKLVEGDRVRVPLKGRRQEGNEDVTLETANILFIAGGAFAGLEELIRQRQGADRAGMGFHAPAPGSTLEHSSPGLAAVEAIDLRHYGLIPELVGRFPVIATVDPLSEDDLVRILTEPRDALIKQYQRLFAMEGVDLEVPPEALRAIAARAAARGTGARGLRGILEQALRRPMYDLPSRGDVTACVLEASEQAELGLAVRFVSRQESAQQREATPLAGNAGR